MALLPVMSVTQFPLVSCHHQQVAWLQLWHLVGHHIFSLPYFLTFDDSIMTSFSKIMWPLLPSGNRQVGALVCGRLRFRKISYEIFRAVSTKALPKRCVPDGDRAGSWKQILLPSGSKQTYLFSPFPVIIFGRLSTVGWNLLLGLAKWGQTDKEEAGRRS